MVKDNSIPSWLKKSLTHEQVMKLSHLVAEAESKTTGEIVPVLIHRSTAIGHVKWTLMGILMALFLVMEGFYSQFSWGWHWTWLPPIAFVVIFFVSYEISKIDWVQRIFTPQTDEDVQVYQRAELEFYRSHIKKTAGGTGILIFVSWMEKRAVILADEGIATHYPPETWDEVVDLMVKEFKAGRTYEGFEVAIRRCGEILQSQLPVTGTNQNELRNHLVIKD